MNHSDLVNEAVLIDQQSRHDISLLSCLHRSSGIDWLDTMSDGDI